MFDQILQSLKGDRNSFKSIFQEYYQPLFHLSKHYLEDGDEAKEVVQEAFVKLWMIRQNLDPDSNIRNFLFTLVKNNCLNLLKRRQILLWHHEQIKSLEMHYQYESLARMGDNYLEINELKEKNDIAIRKLLRSPIVIYRYKWLSIGCWFHKNLIYKCLYGFQMHLRCCFMQYLWSG